MATTLKLTAYGVRVALWETLNEDIRNGSPISRRWLESEVIANGARIGATKRQVINALMTWCDHGDMMISPNLDGTCEYQMRPECFGLKSFAA